MLAFIVASQIQRRGHGKVVMKAKAFTPCGSYVTDRTHNKSQNFEGVINIELPTAHILHLALSGTIASNERSPDCIHQVCAATRRRSRTLGSRSIGIALGMYRVSTFEYLCGLTEHPSTLASTHNLACLRRVEEPLAAPH